MINHTVSRPPDQCLARLRQQAPRLMVLGASAGGVEALMALIPAIPADVPFALAPATHLPADSHEPVHFSRPSICVLTLEQLQTIFAALGPPGAEETAR